MDQRQRRISKIAQAIIDEGLGDSDNNQGSRDDFESTQAYSESSTQNESSSSVKGEEQTENEMSKERPERIKNKHLTAEEKQSARDMLRQKLSKAVIKDQFKMTDDEWVQHLAVTTVCNKLARDKAATAVALENIEYKELTEKQQQKFTDIQPCTMRIQSSHYKYTFQAVLELHFGAPSAKYILQCLSDHMTPEQFDQKLESKNISDQCDYRKFYDAWMKAEKSYVPNKKVFKINYDNGRLSKIENLDARSTSLPSQHQHVAVHSQQLVQEQLKQQQLSQLQRFSMSQQQLISQQKYQMEILQKQQFIINQSKSNIYNKTFTTKQVFDQSKYETVPNSKGIQTNGPLLEIQHIPSFQVVNEPAKKSFFNKFYNLLNGVPQAGVMNVQMQTDPILKQLDLKEQIYITIDDKEYPLSTTSDQQLKELLKSAQQVKILRGKGRTNKQVTDFFKLLKSVRPDIANRGDDLYQAQKSRPPEAKQKDDDVKAKVQKEGTFLTLDGMYQQPSGKYEVADVAQEEFYLSKDVFEYNVSNGHEMPCFIDKWFDPCTTDSQQQIEKAQVAQKFKYTYPATGQGYNTVEEYKQIQQKLKNQQIDANKQTIYAVNDLYKQTLEHIRNKDFQQANACYQRAFSQVLPKYLEETGQKAEAKEERDESDMVYKILGSHRYREIK